MKGQNDIAMFIVIMVLCLIALLWAIVNLFDGYRVLDVSATTSDTVLLEKGDQNG